MRFPGGCGFGAFRTFGHGGVSKAGFFLTAILSCGLQVFAQSPEEVLQAVSARYTGHANGHFQYERRVYRHAEVPIGEIRDSRGIVDRWATSETLRLHDSNDCYWENDPGYVRYRVDSVNLLPAGDPVEWTPGSREALDYAVRNYSRVYVKDTKKNHHYLAYRIPGEEGFAIIHRAGAESHVQIDPPGVYDGALSPCAILFSHFMRWDNLSKRCGAISDVRETPSGEVSFEFQCDGEIYAVTADPASRTLRSYEYRQQFTGSKSDAVPLLRVAYEDYVMDGPEVYPRRIRAQFFNSSPESGTPLAFAKHLAVTTFEYDVKRLDFDRPEYSEKLEFGERIGNEVIDTRFGPGNQIHYEAVPHQTDADILAIRKRQEQQSEIRTYTKSSVYAMILLVVAVAGGIWTYRGRKNS